MDFTQRNGNQTQPTSNVSSAPQAHSGGSENHSRLRRKGFGWLRLSSTVLLFSATVLIIAMIIFLAIGGDKGESKYVNTKHYQAVFLNGGTGNQPVYFGHIKSLTNGTIDLQNVFYLQNNQQVQSSQSNNNYTLIKLGCELHGPYDEMVINRAQVMFWENIKDNGRVSQAISDWYKQNPNGQNCSQTNTQSNSSSTNNATPSATTTTPSTTTPSSSTPSTGSTNSTTKH